MCTNESCLLIVIVIFIFFFSFEIHCVCNNIIMKRTLLFFYITCFLITSCINTNIHSFRSESLLSNDVYSFPLFNAAQTGLQMLAHGLGVGFYGTNYRDRILSTILKYFRTFLLKVISTKYILKVQVNLLVLLEYT